jgi:tetratricopeptide (TPR) repeat protein
LPYQLKGDLYRDQYKWHAAIEQYQKAIETNPEAYFAYINMGFSYNDLRDYASARTEFLAASVINPSRPETYYYAAEAYIGEGNFEAAIPFYEQALETDDQYFLALLGLGKTYAAKDECSLANPYFRKVLGLNLGNEDATQGLNNCTPTP